MVSYFNCLILASSILFDRTNWESLASKMPQLFGGGLKVSLDAISDGK